MDARIIIAYPRYNKAHRDRLKCLTQLEPEGEKSQEGAHLLDLRATACHGWHRTVCASRSMLIVGSSSGKIACMRPFMQRTHRARMNRHICCRCSLLSSLPYISAHLADPRCWDRCPCSAAAVHASRAATMQCCCCCHPHRCGSRL